MRLTLRTLLAYLDDILEPQDAKELAEKIEDSEFASGLVHRIRGSIGRVRLSGPQVLGHGVGADPNSVAEYLDNTLPPDRFPEFEKVCLESDALLSEVASCHQILALVLGEPSQFESSLRQRIYELPQTGRQLAASETAKQDRTESGEKLLAGASGAIAANQDESQATATAARPTDGRPPRTRRWWPVVTALVVGLLVTWGALVAMGPLDNPNHPLAWALGVDSQDTNESDEAPSLDGVLPETTDLPSEDPVVLSLPTDRFVPVDFDPESSSGASADTTSRSATPGGADGPPSSEPRPVEDRWPDDSASPAVTAGGATSDTTSDTVPSPVQRAPLDSSVVQDMAPRPNIPRTPSDADAAVTPATALPNVPGPSNPVPGNPVPGNPVPGTTASEGSVLPIPPPPPNIVGKGAVGGDTGVVGVMELDIDAPLQNVGRFISDQEVLAIADESAGWLRLRPRSSLNVGDQLVALPTYRPKLLLANDMQMTTEGGTSLTIVEPLEGRTLTIEVHQGRLLLIPVGRAKHSMGLAFGDRKGVLTFADADSELAIEVRRERLQGTNPQEAAHVVVRMWPIRGRIQWKGVGDTSTKTIEAGQLYLFVDDEPGHFLDASLPKWAGDRRQSDSMAMASRSLEPQMRVDRSVTLALSEAMDDRRVEVRALAARCLSYLDRFEPLIQMLNDPSQRAWWTYQIDALHEALARSPATAERVRQDLAKVRGARGAALYRLVYQYSPRDLQEGEDAQLVDYLDSEDLDFRVLGFDNLQRITGAHLMYQPWYTAARRRGSVVKWRKRLAEGLIVYRSPPVIAAELGSVR